MFQTSPFVVLPNWWPIVPSIDPSIPCNKPAACSYGDSHYSFEAALARVPTVILIRSEKLSVRAGSSCQLPLPPPYGAGLPGLSARAGLAPPGNQTPQWATCTPSKCHKWVRHPGAPRLFTYSPCVSLYHSRCLLRRANGRALHMYDAVET